MWGNMPAEQIASTPPPQRPYRWGKVCSWCVIALGVSTEIALVIWLIREGPSKIFHSEDYEAFVLGIIFGIFLLVTGRGLLRKRTHGLVLMLFFGIPIFVGSVVDAVFPWVGAMRRPVAICLAVFLALCLSYYIKRHREFR